LKIGVIIDQAGSFFVLATAGVITCSIASKGKFSVKKIIKDIIIYPPFAGFLIGLIINISGIQVHPVINEILQKLGSVMIILALISVGMQLNFKGLNIHIKNLFIGLSYKLIIAPLIIYILFYLILKGRGLVVDVSLIESAMPPMVMGAVMAVSYDLNSELANMMVGIGIPLSFFTILMWYYITILF
jgi:predicted permease